MLYLSPMFTLQTTEAQKNYFKTLHIQQRKRPPYYLRPSLLQGNVPPPVVFHLLHYHQPGLLFIMKGNLCTLLATALVSFMSQSPTLGADGKPAQKDATGVVKAYYPSYNYQGQSPGQIDFSPYTDLLFFAVIPQLGNKFSFDPSLTEEQGERLVQQFVRDANSHNVKPIVSFGGWAGSRYFSTLTRTDKARKAFARALVDWTQKRGFVGIEIDWEYPHAAGIGCNAQDPKDTINFGLLAQEIRTLWPKVQLTAAIGITGLIGASGSAATKEEVSALAANLNYINLMAYDVFGSWSLTTGPIAPLYNTCAPPASAQSVETGVKVAIDQGFRPAQIILGIPGYAKRFELLSSHWNGTSPNGRKSYYYQPHTPTAPPGGMYDDRPGKNDICGAPLGWSGSFLVNELISNGWLSKDEKTGMNGFRRHFDNCSGQPFLTNGKYLISYDDTSSTEEKARYAKKQGLAGIYFFDTMGPTNETVKAAAAIVRS